MADDYTAEYEADPTKNPHLNDDSQPSVTSADEALRLADIRAGVNPKDVVIPLPADVLDQEYRKRQADVSVDEAIAKLEAGEPDSPVTRDDDVGSGPYEGRSHAQLQAAARAKGLPTSGSKAELAERLRG